MIIYNVNLNNNCTGKQLSYQLNGEETKRIYKANKSDLQRDGNSYNIADLFKSLIKKNKR